MTIQRMEHVGIVVYDLSLAVVQGRHRPEPANTPGIRNIAFAVEDIEAVDAGLRAPRH